MGGVYVFVFLNWFILKFIGAKLENSFAHTQVEDKRETRKLHIHVSETAIHGWEEC